MGSNKSKRKLKNVRLTRKFHFQYMGLWVAITVALIIVLNLLFYLLVMQQWNYTADDMLGSSGAGGYSLSPKALLACLGLETVAFAIATVYLARLTSHRIAGPYLGLKKTCERIRDGETSLRQRFRGYDRLEDLEKVFNEMLDAVCSGQKP